jgi:hypothetical protein
MSKPTVAKLDERITKVEKRQPNVYVAAGTVWNYKQLNEVIDKHSRYGELIKMELTIDHAPSKNAFHYIIWHYRLLNREAEL